MTDWRKDLEGLFAAAEGRRARHEGPSLVRGFLRQVVVPAFEELAETLRDHGRDVEISHEDRSASILVLNDEGEEFYYEVTASAYGAATSAFPAMPLRDPEGKTYRAEAHLRDRGLDQDVTNASKEEIISSFIHEYRRHLMWHL